jgi:hypothetical protein
MELCPSRNLICSRSPPFLRQSFAQGPAQVVGAEVLDPNLLCRLLDDRPNRPIAQLLPNQLAALESGRSKRPSSILAAIIQASIPCLTQSGIATVRCGPGRPSHKDLVRPTGTPNSDQSYSLGIAVMTIVRSFSKAIWRES